VTTASLERSFSSYKRLKTYPRSTIGTDKLNGLSLLYIHPDVPIMADEVTDDFARKSRKHAFAV